jgi:hypothetical protein
VTIPFRFMDTATASIKRGGLFLSRVPIELMFELIRYGGDERLEMLSFVSLNLPDLSAWRILDACLYEIYQLLKKRVSIGAAGRYLSIFKPMNLSSNNVFREILLCLFSRLSESYSEINVFTLF